MKRTSERRVEYPFRYRRPPPSGNVINGLSERNHRRAVPVFHAVGRQPIAWGALQRLYHTTTSFAELRAVFRAYWEYRRAVGPVARKRTLGTDPAEATSLVKQMARDSGSALVGVTRLDSAFLYEGLAPRYEYAVCVARPMELNELRTAPSERAALAVLRGYHDVTRVANDLAQAIRELGWAAEAAAGLDSQEVLHIPLAISAGLGQLGKHGSLMSREHGPNIRLAAVMTDLPLVPDAPVEIAVDDACTRCHRCEQACPVDAIGSEKQTVRGERKWYVDFDRCAPYFVGANSCGFCLAVCPWSKPGVGRRISERLLARRNETREGADSCEPS